VATCAQAALGQSLPVLNDSPLPAAPETLGAGILWQMLASVVVVLALGVIALWMVRKVLPRMGRPVGKAKTVRVLETTAVGPRRSVHLLQVGGKKILIGDSPSGVVMLAEVTGAYGDDDQAEDSQNPERAT
jgi:flagellar biogenesis protein FliO